MSKPFALSEEVAPDLHHADGIWKAPMKVPVAEPVSMRENPVAPRPASISGARLEGLAELQI